MKPPVALLLHASADANAAFFVPFAEFSPEWQAMQWALRHNIPARFIDWPAGISIHRLLEAKSDTEKLEVDRDPDPLDALAEAAGFGDGEQFWNSLIEQGRLGDQSRMKSGPEAAAVFLAIENAMGAVRAEEPTRSEQSQLKEARREA